MNSVSTTSTVDPVNMYDYINNWVSNPMALVMIALILSAYFILFYSLGNNMSSSPFATSDALPNTNDLLSSSSSYSSSSLSSGGSSTIMYIGIGLLIVILALYAFQYYFNVNITAYFKNLFSKVDIVVDDNLNQDNDPNENGNYDPSPVPEIKFKKQVFNIPGNYYNYEDAKALCTSYGADLATYKQIEDAYEKGAEWCNYGWSKNQEAYFPTQQQTFDYLQTVKGHEHDCGRPGVNGGYIANPDIRFGVNCFGNKPKITNEEEDLMKIATPYPVSAEDIAFQKRVDYWKNKINDILVSPFNYDSWSM